MLQSEIPKRACTICGIYFVSLALLTKHVRWHLDKLETVEDFVATIRPHEVVATHNYAALVIVELPTGVLSEPQWVDFEDLAVQGFTIPKFEEYKI